MILYSLARDAVRLHGVTTRRDLDGCYGLIQRQCSANAFLVRVAREDVLVDVDHFLFLGDDLPVIFDAEGMDPLGRVDIRKQGLVLDRSMRNKYTAQVREEGLWEFSRAVGERLASV